MSWGGYRILENHIEKNMEHHMETRIISYSGGNPISDPQVYFLCASDVICYRTAFLWGGFA